jgi:hypothetical protein
MKKTYFIFTFILTTSLSVSSLSVCLGDGMIENSDKLKLDIVDMHLAQKIPADSIKACSLLNKSEVEKLVGRPVLEPKDEHLANMYTCTYGDPEYPGVSVIVSISLIISLNQKESMKILEMTRKNAASVEEIKNLGDKAFYDKILKTLWIVKNKYEIGIEVDSEAGGLDTSQKIAVKILERLP